MIPFLWDGSLPSFNSSGARLNIGLAVAAFLETPGPKWFEDGAISTEPRAPTGPQQDVSVDFAVLAFIFLGFFKQLRVI